jgi:hypothetical protein
MTGPDSKCLFLCSRPVSNHFLRERGAALLRNNKKCNELEDDRESCLHVLTWTALRFTNHTTSGGGISRCLRAFDEEYEDGVKGGDLKKGFLLGRDIPRVIKFDRRTHLEKLIEELTEACAVRYEKPPSAEQINQLQRLRDKGLTDEELGNDTVLNYEKRMAFLKSPDWLVHTFRRYLDADLWPLSDKVQRQSIGTGSSKKRAREQDKLEVRIPGTRSQRCSNGSGSHSGS